MVDAQPDYRPAILFVDDEPANLGTFARMFRKHFVVRIADSAVVALKQLACEAVDVVITDYTMPTMNGIDFLHAVAARWPNVKRLILSGHSDLPELHTAKRSGLAVELLSKPCRKQEIIDTVARLLAARTAETT